MLMAIGTVFGTYGLWKLAGRAGRARGDDRPGAWAAFWGGVLLAVVLLSGVYWLRQPNDPDAGVVALLASAFTHVPWVAILVIRARRLSREPAPAVVSSAQ
jgi:hypothetical protein